MLWFCVLTVLFRLVDPSGYADDSCDGSGQPCIAFSNAEGVTYCDKDYIRQIIGKTVAHDTEEERNLYPWWVEEDTQQTLCCDVLIAPPLLIDTLQIEWWYYPNLEEFGSPKREILTTAPNLRTVTLETHENGEGKLSLLTIASMNMSDSGAYACKVSGNTEPPGDSFTPLTIARISEPYAINVYNSQLAFEDESYDESLDNNKYTVVDYKLKALNPNKELVIEVSTDSSLLQYVDLRNDQRMVVSAFGFQPYDSSKYERPFTIKIFYEGEEDDAISRTWTISGYYYKTPNTIVRPDYGVYFDKLTVNDILPFFVIGSCAKFVYNIRIDQGEPHNLEFSRHSSEWTAINDNSYTLKYRFINDYLNGDLKEKNAYVELMLSRDSYETEQDGYRGQTVFSITVTCTVGNNRIPEEVFQFKGKPMFPNSQRQAANCLSYDDDSLPGYSSPQEVLVQRQFPCCETQAGSYGTAYAWLNGEVWSKGRAIETLYLEDKQNDARRYAWFGKYAGYYQCFVGKYSERTGLEDAGAFYRTIKSRTLKMGFDYGQQHGVEILEDDILSYLLPPKTDETGNSAPTPTVNVSEYSFYNSLTRTVVVLSGSCVSVLARANMFPKATLTWKGKPEGSLFTDEDCTEPADELVETDELANFSFIPYDDVTMTSSVYLGPVVAGEQYQIWAQLSAKTADVTVIGISPYCNDPIVTISRNTHAGQVGECLVTGYPLKNVTMYYIHKGKEIVLHAFSLDSEDGKIQENLKKNLTGHEVTIRAYDLDSKEIGNKLGCRAFNPFLPEAEQYKTTEIPFEKTPSPTDDGNTTVIVAAGIGVAVLIVLIWIIAACAYMARHPHTKFGDVMCCKTGKYEKIPKNHLAMDPYKLEYFTLNPGVSLGGGHFGIVRRGQCSVLPDRRGEMTDIAIKEVKPCIDKSRREEDLKRERDIMMRLRSHSNVLRIYGYTDDPDQLSIVLEFAPYGSLDKLLMDARRIKTDGYLMPNEQIDNPIQAFESTHIVEFGRQIADGMDYIGRNNIVHRDLAARNIVVAGSREEYVLKITDFGLAREIADDGIYERVMGKEIPIKWTAPESLKNNISTPQSDVWSFGIVLWELCTLGGEPYAGYNNAEVMEKLRSGYRLQKPPTCNDDIYDVMKGCWLEVPEDRPQFCKLLTTLTMFSEKPSDYVRIEDLYETNLDLTLRLQTLQPPVPLDNLASGTSSIPSDPLSPSNPVREPDACLESRDTGHVTTRDNAMATNEYSAEPGLPNNDTDMV